MGVFKNTLRPAVGLFVIAHGLAHSVLPLRGLMDPVALQLDTVPAMLYGAAVILFLVAGFGLLGVRPFTIVTRQALVLASGFSLVAIWRLGDSGLWFGAGTDLVLFVAGLSGLYRYLPEPHPSRGPWHHAIGVTFAVAFITYVVCGTVLWPEYRAWGSDTAEHLMSLPGDSPDRNRALEIQHAVTIDAPPEAVWPWLAQLGQDRAGFYSYDWLERAFGADIHNVKEIRAEWQTRAEGELVRAVQPSYLGGIFGRDLGWKVTHVEPGRAIVLQYWGAFVLVPTSDGKTRFIIRTKISDGKAPAWAATLDFMTFQLPHFIMERRMMLTIKQLAEHELRSVASWTPPSPSRSSM